MNNVSKNLSELWNGRDKKLTQMVAAESMGLTQSAVSRYLKGELMLNMEAVIKFAKILKCQPSDIDPELHWVNITSTKIVGAIAEIAILVEQHINEMSLDLPLETKTKLVELFYDELIEDGSQLSKIKITRILRLVA